MSILRRSYVIFAVLAAFGSTDRATGTDDISAPLCLSTALRSITFSAGRAALRRSEPFLRNSVNPATLKEGDHVFIDPLELHEFLKSIPSQHTVPHHQGAPVEIRVIKIEAKPALIHFRAVGVGDFNLSPSQLRVLPRLSSLASKIDRLPRGEIVFIETIPNKITRYPVVGTHKQRFNNSYTVIEPMVGKIMRRADRDHYIVKVRQRNGDPAERRGIELLVPRDQIATFQFGGRENFDTVLSFLEKHPLELKEGEKVRFRESKIMKTGTVISQDATTITIQDKEGTTHTIGRNRVFKDVGDSATVQYVSREKNFRKHHPGSNARFADAPAPRGAYERLLNGAAYLASLPEFMEYSGPERLAFLENYVRTMLPWSKQALELEEYGIHDIAKICEIGEGVCRHQAAVLAVLLRENGFPNARVVSSLPGKLGHMWVEARVVDSNRKLQTWIADPANGVVMRINEVPAAKAAGTLDPVIAEHYLDPNKKYESASKAGQ